MKQGRGRPLRFVAVVAVAWIGGRAALLWTWAEEAPVVQAIRRVAPAGKGGTIVRSAVAAEEKAAPPRAFGWRIRRFAPAPVLRAHPASAAPARRAPGEGPAMFVPPFFEVAENRVPAPHVAREQTLPLVLPAAPPASGRWQASGWLALRPGQGIGEAPGGGQIGGSQAGLRLVRVLDRRHRIAAFARLAGPLAGRGAEATAGLEWQPLPVSVRLVAERRFGLDGIPGGTGIGLVGGIDRRVAGFRIEGYGQAGAVWRSRSEPYADGALRITRAVLPRIEAGAGFWGAAQRDAQRLDVGPSVSFTIPAEGRTLRATLDWRQRVAGDARPGSGPALTLGADF